MDSFNESHDSKRRTANPQFPFSKSVTGDNKKRVAKRETPNQRQFSELEEKHAAEGNDSFDKHEVCRKRKKEENKASKPLQQSQSSRSKKMKVRRFASQTHLMISDLSSNDPGVASWSGSGEMLIIKDKMQFTNQLPKYFNTTKFESFTKQLNVYGFMKGSPGWEIVNGKPRPMMKSKACREDGENSETGRTCGIRFNEEHSCFWHPYFQRDRQDLLCRVQPERGSKSGALKKNHTQENEDSIRGENRPLCQIGMERDIIKDETTTDSIHFWRQEVLRLEACIDHRKNEYEKKIKDLQLRQCQSVQEIAEEIKGQCSLKIEGDRGMVLEDTDESDGPPDPSTTHLNPWVKRPKLKGLQAKLHASYSKVFDIAEPLVFEEYGLHDLLSAHFQFKGDKTPADFLK